MRTCGSLKFHSLFFLLFSVFLLVAMLPATSWAVDNPTSYISQVWYDGAWRDVGLMDCGVMRYNGEYYIQGNWMWGHMLRSNDLTNWTDPTHVITNNFTWPRDHPGAGPGAVSDADNWVHAATPYFFRGVFYLLFGVDPQFGIATADNPWGPYQAFPDADTPYTPLEHIDGSWFFDDDGKIYCYYVRFTDGNVIWGRELSQVTDFNGGGTQIEMLSAMDNTWENADEATPINEGPWVFKHRNEYYCIYDANGTADGWHEFGVPGGNYALGCAQSSTPLGFRNTNKYRDFVGVNYYPLIDSSSHGGPNESIRMIGQPWIMEGPNLFEHWVGYFSNHDPLGYGLRKQCVDRLHFLDRRAYVDGPTCIHTQGFHPGPSQPQYLGLFNWETDGTQPSTLEWDLWGDNWEIVGGELRQTAGTGHSAATLRTPAADHFLFETNLLFSASVVDQQAGIRINGGTDKWLLVGIHQTSDPSTNNFYYHLHENGSDTVEVAALPTGEFSFDHYHKLRVEKNGTIVQVRLDDRIYTPVNNITTTFDQSTVSIYANSAVTSWDGVVYTVGWDEVDSQITGWGANSGGFPVTGSWSTTANGLQQTDEVGLSAIFKGDEMSEYEFSAQITLETAVPSDGQPHMVGIAPVVVDTNNYLLASVDLVSNELVVQGMREGTPIAEQRFQKTQWVLLDTGQASNPPVWNYTTSDPGTNWEQPGFDDSSWSNGQPAFAGLTSPPFSTRRTYWLTDNIWLRHQFNLTQPITPYTQLKVHHDGPLTVYINGVLALERPRPLSADSNRTGFYKLYEIHSAARETMQVGTNTIAVLCEHDGGSRYVDVGIFNPKLPPETNSTGNPTVNLRASKLSDRVVLWLNGQEAATIPGAWPKSQVGLVTYNMPATFNGILTVEHAALPAPWVAGEVGAVSGTGRSEYSLGTLKIDGGGTDIWWEEDSFHYVRQTWNGDGVLQARLLEQELHQDTSWWAKATLMFREDLDADSALAAITYNANGEYISFQRRDTKGNGSAADDAQPIEQRPLPHWMRIRRSGNTFSGYHSTDGLTWNLVGTRTVNLNSSLYAGFGVSAQNNNALSTARFDHLRMLAPLPSVWTDSIIGPQSYDGLAGIYPDHDRLEIDGSGSTIFGTADECHYVHRTLSGNGSLTALVSGLDTTSPDARCGVMIRGNTTAGAAHHCLCLTPTGNLELRLRLADGTATGIQTIAGGPFYAPIWLRVERTDWGNCDLAFAYSLDGVTWQPIAVQEGWERNCFGEEVQVGLTVTTGGTSERSTGHFESVVFDEEVLPTPTSTETPTASPTSTVTSTPSSTSTPLPTNTGVTVPTSTPSATHTPVMVVPTATPTQVQSGISNWEMY